MSKTSRGQYFLPNGGTLPRAKRALQESHDKFKLYVALCIFHGLLKLYPSEFLQF